MFSIKISIFIMLCVGYDLVNCVPHYDWEDLMNASVKLKDDFNTDYLTNIVKSSDISKECETSIFKTLESLNNLEDWSYKMYNSWGRFPPSGILEGTVTDLGDYDQCLSITPNEVIGESQYCLIDISLTLPRPMPKHHSLYHKVNVLPEFVNKSENNIILKLSKNASFFYWFFVRLGICTPNKCTESDIKILAEKSLKKSGLILKEVNCETKTNVAPDLVQTIALIVFSTFLSINIFSATLNKLLGQTANPLYSTLLKAFSIKANIKKVLCSQTDEELSCINGLRVISIIWVLIGHSMAWSDFKLFRNAFKLKDMLSAPHNQIGLQAQYSVETFFFISGLLTTYITLKYTEGKYEKFSIFGFLISRFIRLTPQLATFILLTTLVPLLGSGPVWNQQIMPLVSNCYSNWWQNLLYSQNLIDPKNMCAIHTWYLASDMQYHFISLIVIIALHKNMKLGYFLSTLLIVFFTLLSSVIIFIYDFAPGTVNTIRDDYFANVWLPNFYFKPWPHGSVFFMGFAFGFIVYRARVKKLSNISKFMIWSLIILGYLACIYDTQYWAYGEPFDRRISAVLYPTTKIIWALCTASLIWMCITGNGSLINEFLSWKAFTPLSRLTYSVYLTHIWIVLIYWGSKRDLFDLNYFSLFSLFSSVIIMSYVIGAIFSILFESPLFALQKYLRDYFLVKQKLNDHYYIDSKSLKEIKDLI